MSYAPQHSERYQRGLDRLKELVSPKHANTFDHVKLVESYQSLDAEPSDYIISFAFGGIYARDSLTQQEQTLVTISTLVALGTEPQLKLHLNTGFSVGLTKEKIVGALLHCLLYIGFPRVLNGLTLVKEVMAERGLTTGHNWMSDNLPDVQYNLLLKDVGLRRGELGFLPTGDLDEEVEAAILQARALLAADAQKAYLRSCNIAA